MWWRSDADGGQNICLRRFFQKTAATLTAKNVAQQLPAPNSAAASLNPKPQALNPNPLTLNLRVPGLCLRDPLLCFLPNRDAAHAPRCTGTHRGRLLLNRDKYTAHAPRCTGTHRGRLLPNRDKYIIQSYKSKVLFYYCGSGGARGAGGSRVLQGRRHARNRALATAPSQSRSPPPLKHTRFARTRAACNATPPTSVYTFVPLVNLSFTLVRVVAMTRRTGELSF